MSQTSYAEFKKQSADLIARIASEVKNVDEETHWDLIDEMKGVLATDAANASSDDEDDQEKAIATEETWVADNLSGGDFEEDVAMALWLRGIKDGTQYLQQAAMSAQIERG